MQVLMDYINELNWLAVLLAAVAGFAANALWYSNALFGKQWMKGAGLSEKDIKDASMPGPMVAGFVSSFIVATALAVLYDVLALDGVFNGILLGVMVAVAFLATNKIMHNLFEQKSGEYTAVTVAGDIVNLALIGGVLALLQ